MEEAQERSRALGRGSCKPKKNTVASLLEHCRAAGIKPTLPLPPALQSTLTGGTGGLGAPGGGALGSSAGALGGSNSSAAAVLASLSSSLSISEAGRRGDRSLGKEGLLCLVRLNLTNYNFFFILLFA